MKTVPLIRYVRLDGNVSLCSLNESTRIGGRKVCLARHGQHLSWLSKSNMELRSFSNCFFMPESTHKSIISCPRNKDMLLQWLRDQVKVDTITVFQFARLLVDSLGNDRQHIITYFHFLYHSSSKHYLTDVEIQSLCSAMPVVDKYGSVIKNRPGLLIPADGSKWAELLDSNPWQNYGYVELGAVYICPVYFAGESMTKEQLIGFLKTHIGASDIPSIPPTQYRNFCFFFTTYCPECAFAIELDS
ncbi:unnamed protein product [Citrullus colocynthis]|uniref:Uncharacterized protein n=1 Tax=Citrullus colocynthis TaxID=252529 RepID=A0ABP0ZC24_9ROSI